jgi:uncharacterized protein
MPRIAVLLPAALAFGFLAGPAAAASFDCARARTPDELAICRTPALSNLDSEMGGLWYAFSRVPMFMGARGARGDEEEEFLAHRRGCGGNVECLTGVYRARIRELHSDIDQSMAEFFRLQNGG